MVTQEERIEAKWNDITNNWINGNLKDARRQFLALSKKDIALIIAAIEIDGARHHEILGEIADSIRRLKS